MRKDLDLTSSCTEKGSEGSLGRRKGNVETPLQITFHVGLHSVVMRIFLTSFYILNTNQVRF